LEWKKHEQALKIEGKILTIQKQIEKSFSKFIHILIDPFFFLSLSLKNTAFPWKELKIMFFSSDFDGILNNIFLHFETKSF